MANKKAAAKNPRTRAIISLVAILVVVAICGYVALFGIGKGTMVNYLKPWGEAISLGLDLRGGGHRETACPQAGLSPARTVCCDANGNILSAQSYLRTVYRAFALSDGFA